jgi:hypothetical protein
VAKRTPASFAVATAFVGASLLSGALAAPVANADPLGAIRAAVNGNRASTPCPAYKYSGFLEGAAQKYARSEAPLDSQAAGYNGRSIGFLGSGDPQAAAINSAYTRGAGGMISNCEFTEFGVGFVRHEDREVDVVTIIFGAPPAPVEAPAPKVEEKPKPPEVIPPPPPPPEVAPTNAVRMDINKSFLNATVTITNTSKVAGKCNYDANDARGILPGIHRDVNLGANGTATLTVPAPPLGSTYHVVLSCTGDFNGQQVEFGHVEQDVSSF